MLGNENRNTQETDEAATAGDSSRYRSPWYAEHTIRWYAALKLDNNGFCRGTPHAIASAGHCSGETMANHGTQLSRDLKDANCSHQQMDLTSDAQSLLSCIAS
jgi:hypothetical protein